MLRLIILFFVCFVAVCTSTQAAANLPRIYGVPAEALADAKERLSRGDESLQPALKKLRADADAILPKKPASVMDKTKTPVSGDKHDYFSFGPYWWPDPAKPDGLPYIRRDGAMNPESKAGADAEPFKELCYNTETLGLAYYFTGHKPYAEKAAQLVRHWFLNPATRMNPHLQYAQAIPGVSDGRGIGLIEARALGNMCDGLALIEDSGAWPEPDRAALTAWLQQYFQWLLESQNGRDESAEHNNHGTWYDVQVAHLALVLNRPDQARAVIEAAGELRVAKHIEPDGSQPHELARTRSLNYSLFNLEGLFQLAHFGEKLGVDLWGYRTEDGRSLRAAILFLAPYANPEKVWLKSDLNEPDRSRVLPLVARALIEYNDPTLREVFERYGKAPENQSARWRLWLDASKQAGEKTSPSAPAP
jgi:hypothetical protein